MIAYWRLILLFFTQLDTYSGRDRLASEIGADGQIDSPLLLQLLKRPKATPSAKPDETQATPTITTLIPSFDPIPRTQVTMLVLWTIIPHSECGIHHAPLTSYMTEFCNSYPV